MSSVPHSPRAFSYSGMEDRTDRLTPSFLLMLCIFFYLPRIRLLDPSMFLAVLGILCLFGCAKSSIRESWLANRWFVPILCTFLTTMIIFGLQIFLHEFVSVSLNSYYFFRILRTTLVFTFFVMLFSIFRMRENSLLLALVIVLSIHTFIAYLQIIPIDRIREFSRAMNVMGSVNYSYRAAGLAVGFDLGGILIGINTVLIWVLQRKAAGSIKTLLTLNIALHAGALLFTSRTGLLLAGFCIIFYSLFFSDHLMHSILALVKIFLITLFTSFFLLLAVHMYDKGVAQGIFNMAFEIPLNLLKGQGLRTESSDDTFRNHFFLKLDNADIFFGNPSTVFNSQGGFFTDVGYVQILNGHGFLGLSAIFFLIFILLMYLISKKPSTEEAGGSVQRLCVTFIAVFMLINLKGPYFFSRQAFDCFTILLAYLVGQECLHWRIIQNQAFENRNSSET